MKVLLIKDVYKLGRAGDVKKVADGYGRNFLLPNRLAVLATVGALKQSETIRAKANTARDALNNELGSVAEKINGMVLNFTMKAGETGKLYGSITTQMIADLIQEKADVKIDRHQIDIQPIRVLGEHKASVRLTVDLNPHISVMVYREGEAVADKKAETVQPAAPVVEPAAPVVEPAAPVVEPAAEAVEPAAEAAADTETSAA